MKKTSLITAIALMSIAAGVQAGEEKAPEKKQETCPVMGGKIDKAQYVDVKGYRIYVCCAGCSKPLKMAPEKYINKLKERGVAIEKTPEKDAQKTDEK